jgi:hypothetical protein
MSGYWNLGKAAAKTKTGQKILKKTFEYVKPKIAKNLKDRRETFESMTSGDLPKKVKKKLAIKGSKLWDTYDKIVKGRKKADKKLLKQTVGGGAATIAGVVGAHEGAKRKWPKYKKFAESEIKTVDGKLKIVPKKKKD